MDGWRCIKENTVGEDLFAEGSEWDTDAGSSHGGSQGST